MRLAAPLQRQPAGVRAEACRPKTGEYLRKSQKQPRLFTLMLGSHCQRIAEGTAECRRGSHCAFQAFPADAEWPVLKLSDVKLQLFTCHDLARLTVKHRGNDADCPKHAASRRPVGR